MRKHSDLRSIRQARKLSLAELAGDLGVTLGYVSHLETGFRKVNDDLVKRLADSLNVSQKSIRQAAEQIEYDNTLSQSWLVNIEINGSPLLEAFKYHLLASKAELDFADKAKVRDQIVRFVADNLPYSVMAELSGNDRLLGQIAEVCRE
jgi:transcriptional regulator with XRE-family HTH domain